MYGHMTYDVARQRMAELQQAGRRASQARELRAAARARRASKEATEAVAVPAIPDFTHEMFDTARDAVPAPRREAGRGRHARSGR